MASQKQFDAVPPFPDNLQTVELSTIPLAGLISGDTKVAEQLFAACQDLGFFLLDLRGDHLGEEIINEIDQLLNLSMEALNLPEEVKKRFPVTPGKSILGFKPRGSSVTETRQQDRYEMLNIAQDGLMGVTDLQPLPDILLDKRRLLTSYMKHGHVIITAICRTLSDQLKIPTETFADLHPANKSSGTTIRMIKAFACTKAEERRTSMIHHTDFGTITLLANVIGGLQVLPAGELLDENAWRWVRPQPGLLIVNLGDVFVQWTGRILRSNVHRIRYAPGEQQNLDRYSLAIVGRPMSSATMKRIHNLGVPSEEETDKTVLEYEWYKMGLVKQGKWEMKTRGGRVISA
ncbi:hypothetical protein QQS21_003919 [Conoideocrella luteorostrata]|uniref:Fe2OG dioxygenase domain-containing protein n=1 Tax=Conoideocrella luteorostrata TaxID=1105319 RepID=A0AAJ0CSC8_9HYPO|nr:hypothetical protein QQS21_003919 [Conoideocrella luteorostrata]